MEIRKVYDELYGMIEDLKKQIAAISGGDEVTITPALDTGTKVADYTIGEDSGVLFAPTPFSFDIGETPQLIGKLDSKDLYIVHASANIVTGVDKSLLYSNNEADNMWVLSAYVKDNAASDPKTPTVAPYYISTDARSLIYCGEDVRYYVSVPEYDEIHAIILFTVPAPSPEPENNTKKRRK